MYRKFVASIQLFVCIAFMSLLDDQVSLPPSVGLSDETGLATMDGMPTFGESLPPSVADTDGCAMQSDHCEVGLPLPVEDIDGHASQSHQCEDLSLSVSTPRKLCRADFQPKKTPVLSPFQLKIHIT